MLPAGKSTKLNRGPVSSRERGTDVCVHVMCVYVCVYGRVSSREGGTDVCVDVRMCVYVCVCVYIYIYIYIYMTMSSLHGRGY